MAGGRWTNEYTGDGSNGLGHLFLWGHDTGHTLNGRTLIYMRGVDASGGRSDGHITHGIDSFEKALELAKGSTKNNIGYTWHQPSKRFIEKPPSKRAGIWVDNDSCVFFVWVDSKILTLQEREAIEKSKTFHIP